MDAKRYHNLKGSLEEKREVTVRECFIKKKEKKKKTEKKFFNAQEKPMDALSYNDSPSSFFSSNSSDRRTEQKRTLLQTLSAYLREQTSNRKLYI